MTTQPEARKAGASRKKANRKARRGKQPGAGEASKDRAGQTPYLILTMRRTGGTSLMGFLSRVSAFPSIQHEPFNKQRAWSNLSTDFVDRYDSEDFAEALSEVLAERPNIKHCLELVPLELTTALIRACAARGYRVFVLSRRNEISRLRSLFLARSTGVWGSRQAAKKYADIASGAVTLTPVDPKMLKRRARRDAEAISAVRAFLNEQEIGHTELVFEDIYARDGGLPGRAREIAASLGIQVAPDDARLEQLAGSANPSSAEILRMLPNLEEFEATLSRIEKRMKANKAS